MSEVDDLKKQISTLQAETLALQFILLGVLNVLCANNPSMLPLVLRGFDHAANVAEGMSIRKGKTAGRLPEALEVIEQLRTSVKGKQEPRREV
jgi:hypothetical protein